LIGAKDHASVQFNIGLIDENGAYTGEFKTVAFAGFLRSIGGSDQALNRLMLEARILKDKSSTKELPKLETEQKGKDEDSDTNRPDTWRMAYPTWLGSDSPKIKRRF